MKHKVFIDGSAGTTGLQIHSRLNDREDIVLLTVPEEARKDEKIRREVFNESDIVFFCLPDDAARTAAGLITNPNTRVIDASTAHRTTPGWVYGLPELSEARRSEIAGTRLLSNPGCHSTGVITLLYPLISRGLVPADYPLAITSLTGYSGGSKAAIAEYESVERSAEYDAGRLYGLGMKHKHIPEIMAQTGLVKAPAFSPVIMDYYAGMEVIIPLHKALINAGKTEIFTALYEHYYKSRFITVTESTPENGYMSSNAFAGTNNLEITVTGSEELIQLVARFDNLGKGASGAAVQNMNIMLGIAEDAGLC